MSVLDSLATHSVAKSSSGPVQFVSAETAIYDETTGRTFQLIERTSDSVPHCASRAGSHADAMLDQLNTSKRLTWERAQLQAQLADKLAKLTDAQRSKLTAQVEQLSATLKDAPTVAVERVDRAARMLYLYGQRDS